MSNPAQILPDPNKPWLGSWESTKRQENWAAFVAALETDSTAKYAGDHKTYHKFWIDGDHYRHEVRVPDVGVARDVTFQLGIPTSSGRDDGAVHFQHKKVDMSYQDNQGILTVETTVPGENKTQRDEYMHDPDGDGLIKVYRVGDVVAKRWYRRRST